MRRRLKHITDELKGQLREDPSDVRFEVKSNFAQQKLQQILESPYEQQSQQKPASVQRKRFVRVVAVSLGTAALFIAFSVRFILQPQSQPDVLALAAQKYEKRKGIIFLQGETEQSIEFWQQKRWMRDVHRRDLKVWSTTDGAYTRTEEVDLKSSQHWESLKTPQGNCYAGDVLDGRRYVSVARLNTSGSVVSGTLAWSCPFGLRLRPRIKPASNDERRLTIDSGGVAEGIPQDMRQTVVSPAKFLRQVRAGRLGRHSLKERVNNGRKVYVLRIWKRVPRWQSRHLKQIHILVLDKNTLEILRFEKHKLWSVGSERVDRESYAIIFTAAPQLLANNAEHASLLRMQSVPTHTQENPFDVRGRRVGKKILRRLEEREQKSRK